MCRAVGPLFRSSNAPRWSSSGCVGEVVALAIVGTLALGVGCLAAGAIDVFERRPDYLALRLLAGVGLVAVVMARRLNARTVAQCPLPRVGLRHPRGTR